MLSEIVGSVWDYEKTHRIIIPTNRLGVMGAGLALQAKKRYPNLEPAYREALKTLEDKGNPWWDNALPSIICAPTKRHWKDKSIIEDVANLLVELSKITPGPFALPRLGCGLGGLKWPQTKILYMVLSNAKEEWLIVHPNETTNEKIEK